MEANFWLESQPDFTFSKTGAVDIDVSYYMHERDSKIW